MAFVFYFQVIIKLQTIAFILITIMAFFSVFAPPGDFQDEAAGPAGRGIAFGGFELQVDFFTRPDDGQQLMLFDLYAHIGQCLHRPKGESHLLCFKDYPILICHVSLKV